MKRAHASPADLAAFDREAAAAAERAARERAHYDRTEATLGWATPRRDLRCIFCSYHLATFPHPVLPIVNYLDRALFERDVRPRLRLARPWRSRRCRHCGRTTVYFV